MNTFTVRIRDSLSKSYSFDNLVYKETLIEDIGNHYEVYEKYLDKNLEGIVRCLSKNYLKVIKYEIQTIDVKFLEPQKKPFRIPLLMGKTYHAYHQSFMLLIEMRILDDVNLLKLKDYDRYEKIFSREGNDLNTSIINLLKKIINNNVEYILK